MRHFSQFEYLDPVNGEIPWAPFFEARNIAMRARSILRANSRSADDIQAIATDAAGLIDQYFDHEKEVKLEEIRRDGKHGLLETDEDGRFIDFRSEAHDEYDIHTSDNTASVDALEEALEWGFDPVSVEVRDLKQHEYFAVAALCLLADYVRDLGHKIRIKPFGWVARESKEYTSSEVASFGKKLLEAAEAVCLSEKYRDVDRIEAKYQAKIEKLQAGVATKITAADYENLREEIKQEIQQDAQLQRRERSEANNDIRHQENRSVKQSVIDDFSKNPRRFDSAEKAADHYIDFLEQQGTKRGHRTVADWIREYARTNGIRFR